MNGEQVYCFKDYTKVHVYKIGKTIQGWQTRLKDLNRNTGPIDNTLEETLVKKVDNCHEAELFLHRKLKEYRILNDKEHFNVDITIIKHWFDKIPGRYIVNKLPRASPIYEHISVPIEVPATLEEPFILQKIQQQRLESITTSTIKKVFCVLCAFGGLAIIVAVIIFVARMEESY